MTMKNKIHLFFDELKEKYQAEPQFHLEICHNIKHQILTILNFPEEDIDFNFTIYNHIEETYKKMLQTKRNPTPAGTPIQSSINEKLQHSTNPVRESHHS
jgi:hypothetical protein